MVKALLHLLDCTGAVSVVVQSSLEAFWCLLYLMTLPEAVQCLRLP